jgi:multidrug resistance efflux pump
MRTSKHRSPAIFSVGDYKEGSYVTKGQLLFDIDPHPFQAALDRAKGQLAQTEAELIQDETSETGSITQVDQPQTADA